jgi:hypothetical protein
MKTTTTYKMMDCTQCFASRSRQTIIDVLHPVTNKTYIYGKTLSETRQEYPDAEAMSVDEFCAWKADQQRTPIRWTETTKDRFFAMLELLPPAEMTDGYRAFLVGEPYDHDAGNGHPRFGAFRRMGDRYEEANRPMTKTEFRSETAAA